MSINIAYEFFHGGKSLLNRKELSHVEELIGEAGPDKTGLLSAQKFKEYPHSLKGYNSTYKIASNIKDWERHPIMVMHNHGYYSYLEVISYIASTENLEAKVSYVLQKTDTVKYYKKNRDIYVCFTDSDAMPNYAYILSSHGVEKVGDASYIDDSFTEIM